MNKPYIGITLDYMDDGEGYSDFPWYALRRQYAAIVENCGGVPIFLPFESYKNNYQILDLISGIIIPGGDKDVPPSYYGDVIKYNTSPCTERCMHEKGIILSALAKNMPILGICHGMQFINVLLGGTLLQDIKEQSKGAMDHKQKMARSCVYHQITIEKNTKLHDIFREDAFPVNSNHRQAVLKLGDGLIASAYSEDGIIEAIESVHHNYVIGVEWHPEILASKDQDIALFLSFIKAAAGYEKTSKSN